MPARPLPPATAVTRPVRAALLVLSVLGALLAWPAGQASAAPGADVTWGVRTAANEQGIDRENFRYGLEPGEELSDAIVMTNHDDAPMDLDVYAADAYTNSSGQLDLVTRDAGSTDLGAWTTLASDSVHLEPGASVEVPFTVVVPDNASPGDHVGGIVTSLAVPEQENGISVDRRLGIRMALRVGGELTPGLAVEDLQVDHSGTLNPFGTGNATVRYTVRNSGNARLSAGQAVSLAGPFGVLPAEADVDPVPVLLPGETWEVSVPVSGVAPTVRVTAEVVLSPAFVEESGISGPVLPTVQADASVWAVPWTLLLLLLLLGAAVYVAVRLRRRRALREEARVQEAVAKALAEQEDKQPVG